MKPTVYDYSSKPAAAPAVVQPVVIDYAHQVDTSMSSSSLDAEMMPASHAEMVPAPHAEPANQNQMPEWAVQEKVLMMWCLTVTVCKFSVRAL